MPNRARGKTRENRDLPDEAAPAAAALVGSVAGYSFEKLSSGKRATVPTDASREHLERGRYA
jgi:hypothetical protein